MNYQESLQYLYRLGNEMPAGKFDLENIRRLCNQLGNPERQFASVLIAGTNGKGSTVATLYSILQQTGLTVGCYTSPHLVSARERIRVGAEWISEADFGFNIGKVVRTALQLLDHGELRAHPTFFELLTAAMYCHFAAKGVCLAVLEVGLGGRLDATNISCAALTLITTLGLDHQQYLGASLEEIAAEKAGIIRSGVPVLLGPLPQAADQVTQEKALQAGAPLVRLQEYAQVSYGSRVDGFQRFGLKTPSRSYADLGAPLRGPQQVLSSSLAVVSAELLQSQWGSISPAQIQDGVRQTRWPGRIQVVRERPRLILDGAHNPDAAENLAAFLEQAFPGGDLLIIFGAMRDKDFRTFGERLFPLARRVFLTHSSNSRSATLAMLEAAFIPTQGEKMFALPSLEAALAEAMRQAQPDSWVVLTGSLYLVGEAMSLLGVDPLASEQGSFIEMPSGPAAARSRGCHPERSEG
jgi:dihydrofolate synthase / folylpolyglutamate synthase